MTLLAFLGAAFGMYALMHHIDMASGLAKGPSVCTINATINCDKVNSSEYSEIFGVPVASFGVLFYVWILILSVSVLTGAKTVSTTIARDLLLPFTMISVVVSIALATVSTTVLNAVCLVCSAMHVVNICLALVAYRVGDRRRSFLGRLSSGLSQLPVALGLAKGTDGEERSGRLYLHGIVLACGVFLYLFPELYRDFARIAKAKSLSVTTPVQVESGVQQWRIAPEQSLPLVADGVYADGVLGPATAQVTIVEFSDLECPWCRRIGPVLEAVVQQFAPRIRLVFKNFPLDMSCNTSLTGAMHKHACRMAAAAQCAREQNKFWDALGFLYTLETSNHTAERMEAELLTLVSLFSLDGDAFRSCLTSDRVKEKIARDIALGNQNGVEGTPTIFVNGRKVPSADERVLKAVILEALATK